MSAARPLEMDDDDGARANCDAALEFGGIEVVSVRADVGENGLGAEGADGACLWLRR